MSNCIHLDPLSDFGSCGNRRGPLGKAESRSATGHGVTHFFSRVGKAKRAHPTHCRTAAVPPVLAVAVEMFQAVSVFRNLIPFEYRNHFKITMSASPDRPAKIKKTRLAGDTAHTSHVVAEIDDDDPDF